MSTILISITPLGIISSGLFLYIAINRWMMILLYKWDDVTSAKQYCLATVSTVANYKIMTHTVEVSLHFPINVFGLYDGVT